MPVFRLSAIISIVCLIPNLAWANDRLTREALVEDVRHLERLLEETHPDPYSAFGGKIAFKREVEALVKRIPERGLTPLEFSELLQPFTASIGDIHTFVRAPTTGLPDTDERVLSARFGVAHDGLFVLAVLDEAQKPLIGAELVSLNGEPLAQVEKRVTVLKSVENPFGAHFWTLRHLAKADTAHRLFPGLEDTISVSLQTQAGETITESFRYVEPDVADTSTWTQVRWDRVPEQVAPFFAVFLSDDVAYFRIATITARESFEMMRFFKMDGIEASLDRFYERFLERERPVDVDTAIAQAPSLVETSYALLTDMKQRGATTLIIDLRENHGGWTPIVIPLLAMLYGDRYYGSSFSVEWITRFSALYLAKMGTTLEEYNTKHHTQLELGDYVFHETEVQSAEMARSEYLKEITQAEYSWAKTVEALDGKPIITPEVVVLVSPGTSSAAYHLMFYLWKLGAVTVGVPPQQAGNTFMEVTPYTLPHSQLTGSISNSAQVFFPDDPNMGRTFVPDHLMTLDVFRAYDVDVNAEVRHTLHLLDEGVLRKSK